VDIDDESMAASRENAAANGVADRLRVAKRPVGEVKGRFPIVLANIESRVLVPLASAIRARLAPGGTLVLSGLLAHEEEELLEVYTALGLTHARTTREKDWIAMVWRAPGATVSSGKKVSPAEKVAPEAVTKASKTVTKASKTVAKASKTVAKASKRATKASKAVTKASKAVTKASKAVAKASKPLSAAKKIAKRSTNAGKKTAKRAR